MESGNEKLLEMRKQSIARMRSFFDYWKKGVELAGVKFFGDGTTKGFANATNIKQLAPITENIEAALGKLSPGEAAFLASMYSFYNSFKGAEFCDITNVRSAGDLTALDCGRREVISGLLINYHGW